MSYRAVETPLTLHSVVQYWGESALIVGRSKPVQGSWQYDLLVSRDGRLVVLPGLQAEEFGDQAEVIVAGQKARSVAGALR